MNDGVAALDRALEAGSIRHVADGKLATPGGEAGGVGSLAHEHAHLSALGSKRVDDVGADEAGRAGDEDHSKFLQ